MVRCPICEKPANRAPLGTFVLHGVLYHEACIPDCEKCHKAVSHFNCTRIWDNDPPNKAWKAYHKRCPAN